MSLGADQNARTVQETIDRRTVVIAALFPTVAISLLNGTYKQQLFTYSKSLFWMQDLGHFVVVPALCLWLLARVARVYPRNYGFVKIGRSWRVGELVYLCLLLTAVFWMCYEPVSKAAYQLMTVTLPTFTYVGLVPEHPLGSFLVALYFALTAAVTEEVMFRAFPWYYFGLVFRKPNVLLYALITAAIFGFIHWENGLHEVIATFVLGFVLALFYAKVSNIWPFIFGHFLIDFRLFYV